MNVLVSGGSGFIGSRLVGRLLQRQYEVSVLTRAPERVRDHLPAEVRLVHWNSGGSGHWEEAIHDADAVVNLAGTSIASGRWTHKRKDLILYTRTDTTRSIVDAIGRASKKPKVLVNASAVGYYGNVPVGDVTEEHPSGDDFLSHVCKEWEEEARKVERFGVRVVLPRTGIVLDKNGGALQRLLIPFRLFAGGPLGNGRQWFPWIHLGDVIGALIHAVEGSTLTGAVNLAAPESVTMKEFCSMLGKVMHRPSWAPVPGFVLKTVLGELAGPLLLSGQKAVPGKLVASGYRFQFPELKPALEDILRGKRGKME